jgi:hypothetical protein
LQDWLHLLSGFSLNAVREKAKIDAKGETMTITGIASLRYHAGKKKSSNSPDDPQLTKKKGCST